MDKSDESVSKKSKQEEIHEDVAEVAEVVREVEEVTEDLTDVSIMPDTKGSSDISPITPMHDELYVILFEDGNTFIGKVTEIHELDRIVRLTSDGVDVNLLSPPITSNLTPSGRERGINPKPSSLSI